MVPCFVPPLCAPAWCPSFVSPLGAPAYSRGPSSLLGVDLLWCHFRCGVAALVSGDETVNFSVKLSLSGRATPVPKCPKCCPLRRREHPHCISNVGNEPSSRRQIEDSRALRLPLLKWRVGCKSRILQEGQPACGLHRINEAEAATKSTSAGDPMRPLQSDHEVCGPRNAENTDSSPDLARHFG